MAHRPSQPASTPLSLELDPASRAKLLANEEHCDKMHVKVRVDTISKEHKVALCSVHQTSLRFGRKAYTSVQLMHRAEWALSPLLGMGITPMLNVRGWPRDGRGRSTGSWTLVFDWIRHWWQGAGISGAILLPEPLIVQRRDPFGMREALNRTLEKAARASDPIAPKQL